MATKEAHSRANIEYNKRQDNIMIRPPKEMGAKIREAAKENRMSVQAFVLQTLYARIGIDTTGVVKNSEGAPLTEEKLSCSISPSLKCAIKKSIQDAFQSFSEEECAKLRDEFEKLVFETFVEESRKQKKSSSDKKNNEEPPKEDTDVNECICQSLL